jgi:CBS domain-containing protein
MLIREVMSTDFKSVDRDATLYDAVELMLKAGDDYVILTSEDQPNGLLTKRKALIACYKTKRALPEIQVSGFAVGFPTSFKPETTVLMAIGHMAESEMEVLPIVSDLELVGIVTREDLLDNASNLRKQAFELAEQKDEWDNSTSGDIA